MKHRFIINMLALALSFILVIGGAYSCGSGKAAIQVEQQGTSFIWKVTSDTTHVYLLGSVHVASQDLYPLNSTIENAFESADYLVVEVNTNNLSQDSVGQLVMQYGAYPIGDGFEKHVMEDLYNQLKGKFQEYSINIALLDNYRPWVIYNVMSQFILESLGYKIEYGIDQYFLEKAKNSNKNILELETMEHQLALMSSIPDETTLKMMQYDIENPETGDYLQGLFDAWKNGDVAKMEDVAFSAFVEEPELAPYYEIVYAQRNVKMAQKIKEYLSGNKTYFIVVGAGHLVGEDGILNLLKN